METAPLSGILLAYKKHPAETACRVFLIVLPQYTAGSRP